jgi:hypothetical protein
MPSVSIIILNYNGAEDTLECLASLDGLDYPDYEVPCGFCGGLAGGATLGEIL